MVVRRQELAKKLAEATTDEKRDEFAAKMKKLDESMAAADKKFDSATESAAVAAAKVVGAKLKAEANRTRTATASISLTSTSSASYSSTVSFSRTPTPSASRSFSATSTKTGTATVTATPSTSSLFGNFPGISSAVAAAADGSGKKKKKRGAKDEFVFDDDGNPVARGPPRKLIQYGARAHGNPIPRGVRGTFVQRVHDFKDGSLALRGTGSEEATAADVADDANTAAVAQVSTRSEAVGSRDGAGSKSPPGKAGGLERWKQRLHDFRDRALGSGADGDGASSTAEERRDRTAGERQGGAASAARARAP